MNKFFRIFFVFNLVASSLLFANDGPSGSVGDQPEQAVDQQSNSQSSSASSTEKDSFWDHAWSWGGTAASVLATGAQLIPTPVYGLGLATVVTVWSGRKALRWLRSDEGSHGDTFYKVGRHVGELSERLKFSEKKSGEIEKEVVRLDARVNGLECIAEKVTNLYSRYDSMNEQMKKMSEELSFHRVQLANHERRLKELESAHQKS